MVKNIYLTYTTYVIISLDSWVLSRFNNNTTHSNIQCQLVSSIGPSSYSHSPRQQLTSPSCTLLLYTFWPHYQKVCYLLAYRLSICCWCFGWYPNTIIFWKYGFLSSEEEEATHSPHPPPHIPITAPVLIVEEYKFTNVWTPEVIWCLQIQDVKCTKEEMLQITYLSTRIPPIARSSWKNYITMV